MSPDRILRSLDPTWQALLAFGGAMAIAFTAALAMAGWVKLPEKVDRQGDAIVNLQGDVGELKRDVPRMRCILEAMARKRDPAEACGLIQ